LNFSVAAQTSMNAMFYLALRRPQKSKSHPRVRRLKKIVRAAGFEFFCKRYAREAFEIFALLLNTAYAWGAGNSAGTAQMKSFGPFSNEKGGCLP